MEHQLQGSPALSSIPKPPAGPRVPCPDPTVPGKKPSGGVLCLASFPGDLQYSWVCLERVIKEEPLLEREPCKIFLLMSRDSK